jgi:hypothetical protein
VGRTGGNWTLASLSECIWTNFMKPLTESRYFVLGKRGKKCELILLGPYIIISYVLFPIFFACLIQFSRQPPPAGTVPKMIICTILCFTQVFMIDKAPWSCLMPNYVFCLLIALRRGINSSVCCCVMRIIVIVVWIVFFSVKLRFWLHHARTLAIFSVYMICYRTEGRKFLTLPKSGGASLLLVGRNF